MEENQDYPPSVIPQESPFPPKPEKAAGKVGAFLWDIVETVVFALAIFVIVYLFLAQPHQVSGSSMFPNFIDKEYLLTNKVVYRFKDPQRGDVIIFKAPPPINKDLIKRVIGLPNDTVKVENGKIFVNDKQLPENYLPQGTNSQEGSVLHNGKKITVPKDSYIVMGDNRQASYDSRDFGPIKRNSIVGKAWIIYWPLKRFGVIKHPNYSL